MEEIILVIPLVMTWSPQHLFHDSFPISKSHQLIVRVLHSGLNTLVESELVDVGHNCLDYRPTNSIRAISNGCRHD